MIAPCSSQFLSLFVERRGAHRRIGTSICRDSTLHRKEIPHGREDAQQLRRDGYRCYRSRTRIRALRATEEFLRQHCPSKKFMAKWGTPCSSDDGHQYFRGVSVLVPLLFPLMYSCQNSERNSALKAPWKSMTSSRLKSAQAPKSQRSTGSRRRFSGRLSFLSRGELCWE